MVSNLINTLLYPLWCWYFIVYLKWGAMGCAMADLLGMILTFGSNLCYTWTCKDIKEAIDWWNLDFADFKAQNQMGSWSAANSIIEGFS